MDEVERVAAGAVEEAGRLLKEASGEARQVEYKGTIDLVTETDRRAEELVVARLRRAFPDHRIVAEEASAGTDPPRPSASDLVWYLDPLDGTTNFAHSYPQFAVSLALARGDEVLFGTVHDPMRNETFRARRGAGATLNGCAISVSRVETVAESLLGTGFPYDRRNWVAFYLSFLQDFMLRSHGVRRAGSAALDLCYVACGRLDGFWEWKLKPWDTAAGALIVREAGGVVSDFRGGPFDVHGVETLASNGRIHAEMIAVLGERLRVRPPWEAPPG